MRYILVIFEYLNVDLFIKIILILINFKNNLLRSNKKQLSKMKWKKLMVIGDSNCQYCFAEGKWISMLSEHLVRKCDVINRGFAGYTTNYINTILPELLEDFEPESMCGVIIFLGKFY